MHKMKEVCGAISHEKTSSGWNPAFNYFYIHTYILPYFNWSNMILGSLLQCIRQKICTNFIQEVILLFIFLSFFKI